MNKLEIMKRTLFLLCLIVYIQLLAGVKAEAARTPMQELVVQVSESSTFNSETLEDIALNAYDVLINVPFVGVQDSLTRLEQVLLLKQALERSSGLRERLLAVTITEGINRLLLFEAARKSSAMSGNIIPPPYQTGSFQADAVNALLHKNSIDEREAIAYIRTLQGTFATFCKSKNFSLEDFLTGEVAKSFPPEWRNMLGQRTALWQTSVERSTLEDMLFGLILAIIDQGKDVEILCDIYIKTSPGSWKELKAQIEQRLDGQPVIRLSFGGYTSPDHIYRTLDNYFGSSLGDWPHTLTRYFVPFFQNTTENRALIQEAFTQYELAEREMDNLPPFGVWLEAVE